MKRLIFIVFVSCLFIPRPAFSFDIVERLEYELAWMGIKAGTAALEVSKDGESMRIISTARSSNWVSVFYPVDDRVESRFFSNAQPISYTKRLSEGDFRRNREYVFSSAGKVMIIDHRHKEKREFDVPALIFDPLSAFYRIRSLPLVVGESVTVPVFDDKKVWDVEIKVLRKEKVNTPVGCFNTIVVKPLMKSEGIFSRSGDILIWLTDDERKVPVIMKTDLSIGSVTAVLRNDFSIGSATAMLRNNVK